MIDFRYHLVSIVSIFLALAVGIALGAGPLKGQLGDTLNARITSLTNDKANLTSQLRQANDGIDKRDQFIESSNKQLLVGRLAGTTVDVVALPGTEGSLLKSTTETLTQAGAKVGGTVQIKPAWFDAGDPGGRRELAQSQMAALGIQTDSEGGLDPLARVLATALQPAGDAQQGVAPAAIKALTDAKLVSVSPKEPEPATSIVVLSAPVTGDSADQRKALASVYASFATAMDRAGEGSLLATADDVGTASPTTTSVVSTVRGNDSRYGGLSTVDNGAQPMGEASVVLGLQEQREGDSGHYGLASDATAPFPVLQGS